MTGTTDRFIQNLLQAWNNHDIEAAAACYAADFQGIDVAEANPRHGPNSVRQSLSSYISAFPDLHFSPIEMVVQDSHVAVHWTACGTHQGMMMNIPPTGRKITVSGSSFFILSDGKVKQEITIWDVAGMLRALGLLPELA